MAEFDAASEFLLLPQEEQLKVLIQMNPDFKALPSEEQNKVLDTIRQDTDRVAGLFGQGKIPPELTSAQRIFKAVQPQVQPAAELGAFLFGGGTGALAAGPVGAFAGSGLALAGVRSFFRGVESFLGLRQPDIKKDLIETAKDVAEGAAFEAGGAVIGPILKPLVKVIGGLATAGVVIGGVTGAITQKEDRLKGAAIGAVVGGVTGKGVQLLTKIPGALGLTEKGAQAKALAKFEAESLGTALTQPQIERNIEIGRSLEQKVPGLTFTQGQLTNDASAISLERSLARKGGQDLSQSQREFANQVLDDFFAINVAKTGDPAAVAKQAGVLRGQLQASTKEAEQVVTSEVLRLSRKLDVQDIGRGILTKLSEGRQFLKDRVSKMFNKIPNLKVNPESLSEKISKVRSEILKGEDAADFPKSTIDIIENLIFKKVKQPARTGALGEVLEAAKEVKVIKNVDVKTIRGINRRINAAIQKASGALEPNQTLVRRLQILKEGIGESYQRTISEGGQVGIRTLEEANALRIELAGRFEQGTVADVLQRGRRGEATRIALANIGKEFDSLDGIDDFIKATGNQGVVKETMRDFYSFNLLNAAKDPSTGNIITKKANQWLVKNSAKLKKLGLFDEFKNVSTLQGKVDELVVLQDAFNKSVVGRILETDTDSIIKSAFKGSKNFARTAQELMDLVKGNKEAEQGLKKAMAQHLVKQSETTAVGFFQQGGTTLSEIEFVKSTAKLTNQIKKFSPALKVIYKDEPERLKALEEVWQTYQTLSRTAKAPSSGGSDTFELFSEVASFTVGTARPGLFYPFKVVRDALNKFGSEHVEVYLRKAMFDPDYAQNLMILAREGPSPARVFMFNRLMSIITFELSQSETVQDIVPFKKNMFEGLGDVISADFPFRKSREPVLTQGP